MKTFFDDSNRSSILARAERVTADSRPQWGKMNAEMMLAHLVESLRMGVGETSPKSKMLPIRFFPLRELIVYLLPFPKGAPTAPELLPSDRRSVKDSKRELARLAKSFAERATSKDWPRHPAFGNLGRRGWGVLTYRHFDHHLRQFGV
ncbi:MAG TPA: DUF1569 domain-containing protein [Thermoanaerobaculia bacterium]|nr:DUF1569 domain-containing protein [Thermoanaerobaculia bacterium]